MNHSALQLAGAPKLVRTPNGEHYGYWTQEHSMALDILENLENWGNGLGRRKLSIILSKLPPAPACELVDRVVAWRSQARQLSVSPAMAGAAALIIANQSRI